MNQNHGIAMQPLVTRHPSILWTHQHSPASRRSSKTIRNYEIINRDSVLGVSIGSPSSSSASFVTGSEIIRGLFEKTNKKRTECFFFFWF
jgi:hypothetical protein